MAVCSDYPLYADAHPHAIGPIIDTSLQGGDFCESVVFDSTGEYFVGHAGGDADIQKYTATETFGTKYDVAVEAIGSDWIELSSAGTPGTRTLFYTSEGTTVFRFNEAGGQLADFSNLGTQFFALRLLPPGDGSGGLLAANRADIKRLDGTGSVAQTYDAPGEDNWFALNRDPNGTSFWAGDFGTDNFYRFDIASGAIEVGPINAGPGNTLFGLCVKGELTAPIPQGACCTGTVCTVTTAANCAALMGNYRGDNTTCNPNTCAVVVPSQSQSTLIGLAVLLLAAITTVVFLRSNTTGRPESSV